MENDAALRTARSDTRVAAVPLAARLADLEAEADRLTRRADTLERDGDRWPAADVRI